MNNSTAEYFPDILSFNINDYTFNTSFKKNLNINCSVKKNGNNVFIKSTINNATILSSACQNITFCTNDDDNPVVIIK